MDNNLVFGYQTLLDPKIRREVFGRDIKPISGAVLPNYHMQSWTTPEGDDFHTLISNDKERVYGFLFSLNDKELESLDEWEDEYHRIKVVLLKNIEAWTYVLNPEYEKHIEKI